MRLLAIALLLGLAEIAPAGDRANASAIPALEKFDWHPKELVAILGEHKGRQGGAVTSVAYSRNGKMLVSGSSNAYIRFWDPTTMRLERVLGHGAGTYALVYLLRLGDVGEAGKK